MGTVDNRERRILYIGWNTRGRRATGPKKGLLKERKFV